MSNIQLQTIIRAPIGICFDLSRSIELHILSTAHTNEKVVAGKRAGLCNPGDTITWRARHFGIYQNLKVGITEMQYPDYFEDKMLKGAFKYFTHKHYFTANNDGTTLMEDNFAYTLPFGIFGKIFDKIILHNYMKNLLEKRNGTIKHIAESGFWQEILKPAINDN
jgi:ligand-binding SRPBCC domain-containing protein